MLFKAEKSIATIKRREKDEKVMREIVKATALRVYHETGIKSICEDCFYLTDPKCPNFPHICMLEKGLQNPQERDWILKNLADKVEMRKRFKSKISRKCEKQVE